MLTPDEVDHVLYKLEFNLPLVDPAFEALRTRLHLSEKSELLLERFQTRPSN